MDSKTLKDLKHFSREDIARKDFVGIALQSRTKEASKKGYTCAVDINPEFIHAKSLREEVIKWIKELKKFNSLAESNPFFRFRHDAFPIIDFIMHRFNIPEEDLK